MGLVFSWFRRKKTTTDVLETLDYNIKSIEQRGQWTQMQHQRIVAHMTAYSVGIYVMFAVVYYFMFTGNSVSWLQSVTYASPFLALPVLVVLVRRLISWYYDWLLSNDRTKLTRLKAEKKQLLEKVMETETYKVAKEILDKYGETEQQSRALKAFVPSTNVPGNSTPNPSATPGQIRQRQLALQSAPTTPITPNSSFAGNVSFRSPLLPEQLPHPLVPNHLTVMDRVLNFFLNDGANKRFALICSNCSCHNGMVLEEVFEFTGFVCAYCGKHNPSRKQRPRAPPLAITPLRELHSAVQHRQHDSATSSSEDEDEKHPGKENGVVFVQPEQKTSEEKKED